MIIIELIMENISLPYSIDINKLAAHLISFLDNETYDVVQLERNTNVANFKVINDRRLRSGSKISLNVRITKSADATIITIGEPEWQNIAGSIGSTLIGTLISPMNILGRIDDLTVDIVNIQLPDRIKQIAKDYVEQETLRVKNLIDRSRCQYCGTRNELKANHCDSCGAPLQGDYL